MHTTVGANNLSQSLINLIAHIHLFREVELLANATLCILFCAMLGSKVGKVSCKN